MLPRPSHPRVTPGAPARGSSCAAHVPSGPRTASSAPSPAATLCRPPPRPAATRARHQTPRRLPPPAPAQRLLNRALVSRISVRDVPVASRVDRAGRVGRSTAVVHCVHHVVRSSCGLPRLRDRRLAATVGLPRKPQRSSCTSRRSMTLPQPRTVGRRSQPNKREAHRQPEESDELDRQLDGLRTAGPSEPLTHSPAQRKPKPVAARSRRLRADVSYLTCGPARIAADQATLREPEPTTPGGPSMSSNAMPGDALAGKLKRTELQHRWRCASRASPP